MIRRSALVTGLLFAFSACSTIDWTEGGKRWRDSLCREKYGHDCIDPGEARRGPPDHNDPESLP